MPEGRPENRLDRRGGFADQVVEPGQRFQFGGASRLGSASSLVSASSSVHVSSPMLISRSVWPGALTVMNASWASVSVRLGRDQLSGVLPVGQVGGPGGC